MGITRRWIIAEIYTGAISKSTLLLTFEYMIKQQILQT
jgi:hypothetical protein